LLLTHRAEEVERLPHGAADIALAGHTHGGQIYVPFLTEVLLDRKFGGYAFGLYRVNDVPVYVNRGLGSLGIEARFLRRPELTFITLRPGAGRSELAPAARKVR
jgi:predicted MPP superfamily phosphohydrolase